MQYLSFKGLNGIGTHNHLVCKQTFNLLAKLTFLPKWFSIGLRTKWLWVRVPLQLLIRDFLSFLKKALWEPRVNGTMKVVHLDADYLRNFSFCHFIMHIKFWHQMHSWINAATDLMMLLIWTLWEMLLRVSRIGFHLKLEL